MQGYLGFHDHEADFHADLAQEKVRPRVASTCADCVLRSLATSEIEMDRKVHQTLQCSPRECGPTPEKTMRIPARCELGAGADGSPFCSGIRP